MDMVTAMVMDMATVTDTDTAMVMDTDTEPRRKNEDFQENAKLNNNY